MEILFWNGRSSGIPGELQSGWGTNPDKSRRVMDGGLFKSSKSAEEVFLFTLENKRGGFIFPPYVCFQASNCGHWQEERSGDWKTTTATNDRRETKLYCQMYGRFKHLFGQLNMWVTTNGLGASTCKCVADTSSSPASPYWYLSLLFPPYLYRTQGTSAVLSLHSTYFCLPVAYPNICHQNQYYKHEH